MERSVRYEDPAPHKYILKQNKLILFCFSCCGDMWWGLDVHIHRCCGFPLCMCVVCECYMCPLMIFNSEESILHV